jgi:hypothetical protein
VELLDPQELLDGSFRATFDLGRSGLRHSEVELTVPDAEFSRRVRIETSDELTQWGAIARGRVFRLSGSGWRAEHMAVSYPVASSRYLRVTMEAVAGERPVRIEAGRVRLRTAAAVAPTGELALRITSAARSADGRSTVVVLDAEGAGVPLSSLSVEVGPGEYERRVTVEEANEPGFWIPAGGGVLYRAPPNEEGNRLEVSARKHYLRMLVDNGDDPPLRILAVRGRYPLQQAVFRAAAGGTYALYLGAPDAPAPAYDLASVLSRAQGAVVSPVNAGALRANPRYAAARPASAPPWSERFRWPLIALVGALLLGLSVWSVRLLRTPG